VKENTMEENLVIKKAVKQVKTEKTAKGQEVEKALDNRSNKRKQNNKVKHNREHRLKAQETVLRKPQVR
jgi:hypothetical protein